MTDEIGFDEIVKSLANFRFPEGVSENGAYELKNEYLAEYDPYQIHLSRNEREAAEQYMVKRFENLEGSISRPLLPSIMDIPADSPFQNLKGLVMTSIFVRILFYSLYLATLPADDPNVLHSDLIIDESLYLITYAIKQDDDTRKAFATNACVCYFPYSDRKAMSLLDVLIEMARNDNVKEYRTRVRQIIEELNVVPESKDIIDGFFAVLEQRKIDEAAAATERRRLDAQERQRKIMAQFADAQNAFASTHADLYNDVSSDEGEDDMDVDAWKEGLNEARQSLWNLDVPTGSCIFCQETVDRHSQKQYGLVGVIQTSRVLRDWRIPGDNVGALFEEPPALSEEEMSSSPLSPVLSRAMVNPASSFSSTSTSAAPNASTSLDSSKRLNRAPAMGHAVNSLPGFHVSTCGHLIHLECFQQYFSTLSRQRHFGMDDDENEPKIFACPFCKSYSNMVFPVVSPSAVGEIHAVIPESDTVYDSMDRWLLETVEPMIQAFEEQFQEKGLGDKEDDIYQFERCLSKNDSLISNPAMRRIQKFTATEERQFDSIDWLGYEDFMAGFHDYPALQSDEYQWEAFNAAVDSYFHDVTPRRSRITDEPAKMTSLHQFLGTHSPWRQLSHTITCHEISERPWYLHLDNTIFTTDSSGRKIVYGLTNQNQMALQALARMQMAEVAAPDPHVSLATSTLLLHLFFTTKKEFVTFPLLFNDPFDLVVAYFTDPLLSNTMTCGLIHRKHALRFFLTVELIRITMVLFGPGRCHKETLGKLIDLKLVDMPKLGSAPFVDGSQPRYDNDPVKRFIFTIRRWQTLGIVSKDMDRNAAKEIVADLPLPSHDELKMGYQLDFDLFCWLLDQCCTNRLLEILRVFSKPFLRRVALLFYGALGVEIPENQEFSGDEYEQLSQLFEISLEDSLNTILPSSPIAGLLQHACLHLGEFFTNLRDRRVYFSYSYGYFAAKEGITIEANIMETFVDSYLQCIPVLNPYPYNLVFLPHRLEMLLEQMSAQTCSSCKNIPSDPALCMFCGELLCAHSYCCVEDGKGECYRHMEWYDGPLLVDLTLFDCYRNQDVGMFFLLKKCSVLLVMNDSGCIKNAPYVDVHGETDLGLR